jgi:hypothetical protein
MLIYPFLNPKMAEILIVNTLFLTFLVFKKINLFYRNCSINTLLFLLLDISK